MKKTNKDSLATHTWRFFRAGGFDQVRIDSGGDLAALDQLDRKLWVALACPIDNVHFDKRTLSLIDGNGDRRIRADELIAATRWASSRLKNPDDLVKSTDGFVLAAINDADEEGKKMFAAGRTALAALGKSETDALTVVDLENIEQVFSRQKFNGDGIISEECADDEKVRACIRDIITTTGSKQDRCGKPGIDAELAEKFFTQASAFSAWFAETATDTAILPLGHATEEAGTAIDAVGRKIDDHFTRCQIAGFDERSTDALDGPQEAYIALSTAVLSPADEKLSALPLAHVNQQSILPLGNGCNPAWRERIARFTQLVVEPVLGPREKISENDWQRIRALFAPWSAWRRRKPDGSADRLGIDRIHALLSGDERASLAVLVERDKREAETFASFVELEKLARYSRDLYRLCVNFVNFKDFYSGKNAAIFQAGTLYLDQRSCSLCMKVDDANKHGGMAAMAGAYLVYCDCRRVGMEKMTVVAAFTNGDSENLMPGRNGIFYDRTGNEWDATVIKIIENPISIRQAFWLPYKNLVRMIESQVAKRAAAAEAQSTAKLEQTAAVTATIDTQKPPPAKKIDVGTVAALGVAVGAIGTFLAAFLGYASGIIRLGPFAIAGAIVGVLLLISGPSLILAYIKLRKRNLGPILDANGWAINAKACINVPFGSALTKCAVLPPGSQRDMFDPYAEKKSPWPKIIIFLICAWLAWFALDKSGIVDRWTNGPSSIKRMLIEKKMSIFRQKTDTATPASR